jgi:ABC-type sugar transport system substrate-binding protein
MDVLKRTPRSSRRSLGRQAIAVALALGVSGVLAAQAPSASRARHATQLRIAFFSDSLNNAYLQAAVAAAKQVAAKNKIKMDIFSADWDTNKQLTQIQDAISSGKYQALVVESIDGQSVCKSLMDAVKKKIVVTIYNTAICGNYRQGYTPGTAGYFGEIQYRTGLQMGQSMAQALGGKGKVAYISGPVQNSIVGQTTQGIKDAFKKYPNVKLVSELAGDWDPAKGLAATQDLLQSQPDINGIIYGVDQMAVPSIKWLQQSKKLGKIKIVSLGGTKQAFDLIRQGKMHSTFNSLPREEAAYALQAAIDTLNHRPISVPGWDAKRKVYNVLKDPRFKGGPAMVTKKNVNTLTAEWSV